MESRARLVTLAEAMIGKGSKSFAAASRLFDRTTRGSTLTAAGQILLRRARSLEMLIGDAEADRFVGAVEEFVTARKALIKA